MKRSAMIPLGPGLASTAQTTVTGPLQLEDSLWLVPIPMKSPNPSYSLCMVAESANGDLTVVDPGWSSPEAFRSFEAFLTSISHQVEDIAQVVVTHSHVDHVGLAGVIRSRSGAVVAQHPAEQHSETANAWSIDRSMLASWGANAELHRRLEDQLERTTQAHRLIQADLELEDGDPVPGLPGWKAIHTPGHTAGHLCLVNETRQLILTGDHVLPSIYPGIGLGGGFNGNAVDQYLGSLDCLAPYSAHRVLPGHGYPFTPLKARIDSIRHHVIRRAQEVERIIATERSLSTVEIAARMTWSDGSWDSLVDSSMLLSVLRQAHEYTRFVRTGGVHRYLDTPIRHSSASPPLPL